MPRLPFPDVDEAPEAVRKMLDKLPYDLAAIHMFAHASGAFAPWARMNSAVLVDCDLDPVARELAICVAAWSDSPQYEYPHHRKAARRAGVLEEQLRAIERGEFGPDLFSTRDLAIVRFGDEVVRNVRAADGTMDELRRHFSDRQVVEIILLVAQYMMNSRVAENAGLTLADDAEFARTPNGQAATIAARRG